MENSNGQQQLTDCLLLYKDNFFDSHSHLRLEETQMLWGQQAAEIASILQYPTLSAGVDVTANQPVPMSRAHTWSSYRAECQVPMSRKRSSPPSFGATSVSMHPESLDLPQSSDYTVAKTQRSNSGRPYPTAITVFDPSDYLKQEKVFSSGDPDPAVHFENSKHSEWTNSYGPLEPIDLQQPASDASFRLNAEPEALLTGLPTFAPTMDRNPSSLCNGLDMVRIRSHTGEPTGFNVAQGCTELEDHQYVEAGHPELHPTGAANQTTDELDNTHNLSMTAGTMQSAYTQPPTPVMTTAAAECELNTTVVIRSIQQDSPNINEIPPESFSPKPKKLKSRLKIAPKTPKGQNSKAVVAASEAVTQLKSADGTPKCQISKNPVVRPVRTKIKCPQCVRQRDGFKGQHELQRHTERFHRPVRIVWICVDGSPEGNMLSSCRACTSQKTYGQAHNAAAHLRRIHFNPRPKTPKTKGVAGRAGIGGGDWPPIEELKKSWMKEVEQRVPSTNHDEEEQGGEYLQPIESEEFDISSGEESLKESPITPTFEFEADNPHHVGIASLPPTGEIKFEWSKTAGVLCDNTFNLMPRNEFDLAPEMTYIPSVDFAQPLSNSPYEISSDERRNFNEGVHQISTVCA